MFLKNLQLLVRRSFMKNSKLFLNKSVIFDKKAESCRAYFFNVHNYYNACIQDDLRYIFLKSMKTLKTFFFFMKKRILFWRLFYIILVKKSQFSANFLKNKKICYKNPQFWSGGFEKKSYDIYNLFSAVNPLKIYIFLIHDK